MGYILLQKNMSRLSRLSENPIAGYLNLASLLIHRSIAHIFLLKHPQKSVICARSCSPSAEAALVGSWCWKDSSVRTWKLPAFGLYTFTVRVHLLGPEAIAWLAYGFEIVLSLSSGEDQPSWFGSPARMFVFVLSGFHTGNLEWWEEFLKTWCLHGVGARRQCVLWQDH